MRLIIDTDHTEEADMVTLAHHVADQIDAGFTSGYPDGRSYWKLENDGPPVYFDEPFEYKHTHASKRDGSPAMLVSKDPFRLVNEDGYEWTDDPDAWEEIGE